MKYYFLIIYQDDFVTFFHFTSCLIHFGLYQFLSRMCLYNLHFYYYFLLIFIFIFVILIEEEIHLKFMSDSKDFLPYNYIDFHISHH